MDNFYTLYSIKTYAESNKKFIKDKVIYVDDVDEMLLYLKSNNGYHFRIQKDEQYIFFGNLDDYKNPLSEFIVILQKFMKDKYNLIFTTEEFKYTQNNEKETSYHYSIPKWNASTEKLKEIHTNLLKEYSTHFINKTDKKISKCIDTTIYSEHWFRCPNQKKETSLNDTSMHIIKIGDMKDFVIKYIPKNSININDINVIENNVIKQKNNEIIITNDDDINIQNKQINNEIIITHANNDNDNIVNINNDDNIVNINNEKVLSQMISKPTLYKKMFDECYKQERFDMYDSWISIGMALRNTTFDNEDQSFELFNYFSSKGNNYNGIEITKQKFNTFLKKSTKNKFTAATIYYYAKEDNKLQFIKIMNNNTFDLEQYDMCNYIKTLAGNKFKYNNQYNLYCFNDKIWEKDSVLLKKFISNELYEFLKMILTELYFEHKNFNQMKSQIKKLKTAGFKKDIIETYKEVGTDKNIKFDNNPYLLGFNNVVYDLEIGEFRDYKYDDYVSNTTKYDWREPTNEEINTITNLIEQIMPIKEERDLYLQILATSLDGKCLEKCIIFNGNGGNGKGMINDLLLLGLGDNYSLIGNNSILFESSKTGSNPEKANIHKKRLVIFREPPEKQKFCNSVIKELSGGGLFSARGHHESNTQKELNLTMIIECNKKPLFQEEPTNAEVRRIIDIYFRSTFTSDEKLVDPSNNIYLANPYYKESSFQHQHKYALLKILMNEYNKYRVNKYKLFIPKIIEDRTQNYLELSCKLVSWFKDNYEFTGNKDDICKLKDIYDNLTESSYFFNLSKFEKQKYNRSYLTEYIKSNIFFVKYYKARTNSCINFIYQWKKKSEDKKEECEID